MNNETLDKLKAILLQAQAYLATMIFKEPAKAVMSPFQRFCAFIKEYEGANPENNNPYDFRYYYGGYLPKYGIVKESSGGFAIFSTLALGEEYGEICITEMIQNHPQWTFYDFFNRFAPKNDGNDPILYAERGAAALGVEASAELKSVLNI